MCRIAFLGQGCDGGSIKTTNVDMVIPHDGQCQSVRVFPFMVSMLLLCPACDTPVSDTVLVVEVLGYLQVAV
jgi:hypothetical protein